jgi:hypothetical protein
VLNKMSNNDLKHYGILGMKWGVRRATKPDSTSRWTKRTAKKDAKRYADAKMFYGKTAGTRRKLLKAELDKKKKIMPGYEKEFNDALNSVDFAKSAKKAVIERKTRDATYRTRITVKQFLGVTGPLTVAAATMAYQYNKPQVDAFVARTAKKAYNQIKNFGKYGK